jgi:hypothetical protein
LTIKYCARKIAAFEAIRRCEDFAKASNRLKAETLVNLRYFSFCREKMASRCFTTTNSIIPEGFEGVGKDPASADGLGTWASLARRLGRGGDFTLFDRNGLHWAALGRY